MDTGQEYVEMRIGAIPDLGFGGALKSPITSLATGKEGVYNTAIWVDGKGDWYYIDNELTVQLERQDQLQGMVRGDGDIVMDLLQDFMGWASQTPHSLNSMEQLWLAFAMFELHKKKWDGREWLES